MVTSSAVVGSSAMSERRPVQQRDRDRDALAHAAGQLMRIGGQPLVGRGDPHHGKRVARPPAGGLLRHALVGGDCLDHLGVDAQHRIKRHHRVLEHHRDVPAAKCTKLRFGAPDQFLAVVADRAFDDAARRVHKAKDR